MAGQSQKVQITAPVIDAHATVLTQRSRNLSGEARLHVRGAQAAVPRATARAASKD